MNDITDKDIEALLENIAKYEDSDDNSVLTDTGRLTDDPDAYDRAVDEFMEREDFDS